jgi:hypothetical protein
LFEQANSIVAAEPPVEELTITWRMKKRGAARAARSDFSARRALSGARLREAAFYLGF